MDRSGEFRTKLARLRDRPPFRFPSAAVPRHFRRSAVLLPFWSEGDKIRSVLIRRAAGLSEHPGQIAFPGGRLDPGEPWIEGALREAQEEVGLAPEAVEVLGPLDDAWSGAGHHIVPVVGWLAAPPALHADPGEVAEILRVDVDEILQPACRGIDLVVHRGVRYENTTLTWSGGSAYGLTADLLLEAIEWGLGGAPTGGVLRLDQLRTYFAP
jgi:ADP-ribose pyrophosphatase YjhB (NUDIX family)